MSRIPRIAEALAGEERASLKTIEEADIQAEKSLSQAGISESEIGEIPISKEPFGPKLVPGQNYLMSPNDAMAIRKFNSTIRNVDNEVQALNKDHPEGQIVMSSWWDTVKDQMRKGEWGEAKANIRGMMDRNDWRKEYPDASFGKSLEALHKLL